MDTRILSGLCAALLLAADASAGAQVSGSITAASGAVRINGQQTKVAPGKPVELNRGDLFDTQDATATWRSAAGDEVELEPRTAARDDGVVDGVSALFVRWGLATAQISDRTLVGGAAGWASVGSGARARVTVEVPKQKAAQEAHFLALEGAARVVYDTYSVGLPEGLSTSLSVDPRDRGLLWFRTGQQNAGQVEIRRSVPCGDVVAAVPRGAVGVCFDEEGGVTRILNDERSVPSAKILVDLASSRRSPNPKPVEPGASAAVGDAGVKTTASAASPPAPDEGRFATLARTEGEPGTKLLDGALECVGLSVEPDVRAGKLSAEVENVSAAALTGLEASVAFRDVLGGDGTAAETGWTAVPDAAAGARVRIDFDTAKLGRVARFAMVLRVRRR